MEGQHFTDRRLEAVYVASVRLWEAAGGNLPACAYPEQQEYLAHAIAAELGATVDAGYDAMMWACREGSPYQEGHASGHIIDPHACFAFHADNMRRTYELRRLRGAGQEVCAKALRALSRPLTLEEGQRLAIDFLGLGKELERAVRG